MISGERKIGLSKVFSKGERNQICAAVWWMDWKMETEEREHKEKSIPITLVKDVEGLKA